VKQVALSWSGGKDSTLALAELERDPAIEVKALITSITAEYDRISIHGVRRELLERQAKSLGLPLIEIPLAPKCSNDEYEAAFHAALRQLREQFRDVSSIAFGDLYLEDVRQYRVRLLSQTILEPLFPIWGRDTRTLAEAFIEDGYRAHLVCVDTSQLDSSFAGREFDVELLSDLPVTVDPCGENGEFHTFVSAGPIFREEIAVIKGERVLRDNRFMYCDLTEAR